jgi:hypothetical protein
VVSLSWVAKTILAKHCLLLTKRFGQILPKTLYNAGKQIPGIEKPWCERLLCAE